MSTVNKAVHRWLQDHRARALYLLYGPHHDASVCRQMRAHLLWRDVCVLTIANRDQLTQCFQELGSVLKEIEQVPHAVAGVHRSFSSFRETDINRILSSLFRMSVTMRILLHARAYDDLEACSFPKGLN